MKRYVITAIALFFIVLLPMACFIKKRYTRDTKCSKAKNLVKTKDETDISETGRQKIQNRKGTSVYKTSLGKASSSLQKLSEDDEFDN